VNTDEVFIKTISQRGWQREKINPIEFMEKYGAKASNITYDPTLRKGDYSIVRTHSTDSTLALTTMQIGEILNLLIRRESYHKPNPPDMSRLRDIHYVVGPIKKATVWGHVKLKIGVYPGQRERFRMPVKVQYIYS